MVWGGLDSSRPRPRRGRTIREIRARGDGINGPLRGPKLTIPHTPHHRSCLARCGATIASPLRGLDGKTTMRPAEAGAGFGTIHLGAKHPSAPRRRGTALIASGLAPRLERPTIVRAPAGCPGLARDLQSTSLPDTLAGATDTQRHPTNTSLRFTIKIRHEPLIHGLGEGALWSEGPI